MKAENRGNEGFLQRESVEHQGYTEARSTDRSEGKERDGASDLLEAILDRDNLNRAYKRVKSNHGAAGIDGMSVEEALPWLREHREELLQSIRDGSYEPSPVRRKEIPKPDGGVRKLGIPTVVDRVIQQGIAQKLQNIWEPQFSDSSYGYRPKRRGQQAIQKVKEYAEAGYRYAVSVDLSKYFDTLNHELLMNLLHRKIQDMRVLRIIKKYLKSGVMENGVVSKTEYAGQLNFYLSAVDGILKKEQDNPSIGLLLCKSKNNLVAEYSLKDISKPIGVSEYKVTSSLPDDLEKQLPSVEDIQKRIK